MITKTNFWEKIKTQLKEIERSKQFTAEIMKIIKDTPQSENKTRET